MKNSDLIAYLKPIPSQLSPKDSVELIDVIGRVSGIQSNAHRLTLHVELEAGMYRGSFSTLPGSFDMSSAMIAMVQVPDGKRVPVGPWDLDHIRNVMAVPMMRAYVNGRLKGGLWFSMPGPQEIAEQRLTAEFGFEAQEGMNEVALEFIERDRERMDWGRLAHLELRHDDRQAIAIEPAASSRPRIFLNTQDVARVRERWQGTEEFEALRRLLATEDLVLLTDNSQGTVELASLFFALTGDQQIGARARTKLVELANAPTWRGRPDPLLMGGDNDRVIGLRLYQVALGWEYLQPLLSEEDRCAILAKADEYIGKIYDFTLLQRGYMGCPAVDPHSLGAWNGTAIACMAFFDELEIARRALPFFHGLFCESLTLFPESGKAAWATYFPFHLVLYLGAAHTFGGKRRELDQSRFLDHLGQALLACFDAPNSQELQRGLRTREHRFITAFLCRFHPTSGIEAIYRAFWEREERATGQVALGIFDLLYAPQASGPIAQGADRPLFARDVGDVIATVRGEHTLAVSISGGPKAGRGAVFHLMPHNREFAPSMGALAVAIDGTPVLCNIDMGVYGLNSALTNTMCFDQGGALTNGQYLNGAVAPESCGIIRRCLIDERYLFVHIVITHALDPGLRVQKADRVFILDRKTGVMLISDAFSGTRAIRFATHLHCSGSVMDLGDGQYRLTGGQANLIAGIKGGGKGLDDAERGEIFVQVLDNSPTAQVTVEEPTWVPGYIYGLNNTGAEEIRDGRYPRYRRWRLAANEPVDSGSFLLALTMKPGEVRLAEGVAQLPGGGAVCLGYGTLTALGVECDCECLMWDDQDQRITALGLLRLQHGADEMTFCGPVDVTYNVTMGVGNLYSQLNLKASSASGFRLDPWSPIGDENWKTHNAYRTSFSRSTGTPHTQR